MSQDVSIYCISRFTVLDIKKGYVINLQCFAMLSPRIDTIILYIIRWPTNIIILFDSNLFVLYRKLDINYIPWSKLFKMKIWNYNSCHTLIDPLFFVPNLKCRACLNCFYQLFLLINLWYQNNILFFLLYPFTCLINLHEIFLRRYSFIFLRFYFCCQLNYFWRIK